MDNTRVLLHSRLNLWFNLNIFYCKFCAFSILFYIACFQNLSYQKINKPNIRNKIIGSISSSQNGLNPLMHNVPKWSDTLQRSCSICCKIWVSYDLGTLSIKGLTTFLAQLVSILRAVIEDIIIVIRGKNVFKFLSTFFQNVHFWGCDHFSCPVVI